MKSLALALGAFIVSMIVFSLATCATAPVSFAKFTGDVYNLTLRFTGSPGGWAYKRDFKNYKDCYDFATGRIFEDDLAMIHAANPKATIQPACGVRL